MDLTNKKRLVKFWRKHTSTKKYLENWCEVIEANHLKTPDELRKEFPTITLLGKGCVVFKVKGNDFRLISQFRFQDNVVLVCWIGTHPEYDRIDAMTACDDLAQ